MIFVTVKRHDGLTLDQIELPARTRPDGVVLDRLRAEHYDTQDIGDWTYERDADIGDDFCIVAMRAKAKRTAPAHGGGE